MRCCTRFGGGARRLGRRRDSVGEACCQGWLDAIERGLHFVMGQPIRFQRGIPDRCECCATALRAAHGSHHHRLWSRAVQPVDPSPRGAVAYSHRAGRLADRAMGRDGFQQAHAPPANRDIVAEFDPHACCGFGIRRLWRSFGSLSWHTGPSLELRLVNATPLWHLCCFRHHPKSRMGSIGALGRRERACHSPLGLCRVRGYRRGR